MFQTRLFAPIFYLNREHFLFVYVVIQKQATSFANFIKKNHGFSKFLKIEFFQRLIFENSIIYKLSLGHVRSHKNLGLIRRFYRKNRGFSKFSKIEFCWRQFFFIRASANHGPLTCMLLSIPGVTQDPTKQLAPIGSAALTIIEYKQTDKQSIYYRFNCFHNDPASAGRM